MREPNFSFPHQNRAAICITSSIYDRRALDCTDYIPIINTLTNLAYLTGSTPTIREFVTRDGGLERLVTILKNTKVNDRKNGLKWTLAFQCVVNIGVRGTEHIRKRVVQAGMVPVIVNVLESFFAVLKSVSEENERKKQQRRAEAAQQNSQPMITEGETLPMDKHGQQLQGTDSSSNSSSSSLSSSSIAAPALTSTSTTASVLTGPLAPSTAPSTATLREEAPVQNAAHYNHNMPENTPGLSAMPVTQEPSQGHPPSDDNRSIPMDAGEPRQQQFFYREDDILHSLQLLAYLSKYPSLRSSFHTASGSNVFAIVEKFTHRTMHPLEIQYWAGVIMRNACRKDDTRKGIRQCAYTGCGKWETKPREFAKCRRCRKAKYCSKQCQSKAWNEGHRWWCIEKKAETMGVSSSFGTDLPPAPPPPPPPADLQDQPDADANLMENGGISSVGAGTAGARMIGSDGGGATGHSLSMRPQPLQHQHQHHTGAGSSSSGDHRPHVPSQASPSPQTSHPLAQDQLRLQQMRAQQLQHSQQVRHVPSPLQQQPQPSQARPALNEGPVRRSFIAAPQRAMTHPHPSTAPIMPSPRSELTPHLGITPDSPTPEQLAQRFVQQVALHPGQHNELAQQLNAQFQQYFPPCNQAEAKRQFSFHARDHFARYQRQQELLRNSGQGSSSRIATAGRPSTPIVRSAPLTTTTAPHRLSSASGLASSMTRAQESELAKQGTPRRRSDLDSDDDDENLVSGPHSTMTSLSVPMLTQDLSTTMSLSSIDLSGSLSMSAAASASSSAPFQSSETDTARANPAATRDFKVRKLMAPEESSSPSTETQGQGQRQGQGSSQPTDEWSYSRHMAKDATTIDS
ncbi:hypothetical protein KVV02_006418 [Mortierella alpina]|uniref:MYND-type domain-containing protein n=1 Tax=Mortierella alpina TaxID=64518 RepID=A0A9P8D3H7_MORAP|nr:hypothetical protein KVV02_006418 [Mortierella alpina]